MKKKLTLTIAIPAYNEEANIAQLLNDIAKQKITLAKLEKILVVSDGSTDQTAINALSTKVSTLEVITHIERKGVAYRQNEIFSLTHSEIIVLFNGDIRIYDKNCVDKLIQPITQNQADCTSCNLVAQNPKTFIENILAVSMKVKTEIFEDYHHGDNIYTCHGTARALSKKMYTVLRFPHSVGEDAYTYLFAKKYHMRYQYVFSTQVLYRLPRTLYDHYKQSKRYNQSRQQFKKEFSTALLQQAYYLGHKNVLVTILKYFKHYPLKLICYAAIVGAQTLYIKVDNTSISNTWDISYSSKHV